MNKAFALLLAAFALLLSEAPARSAGPALFAVPAEDSELLASVMGRGASVRHIGRTEAVVEAQGELASELQAAGVPHRLLGTVGRWEALYLCYPAGDPREFGRVGEIIWAEPGGAAVVGAALGALEALRAASFMARPLPRWRTLGSWFDETPGRPVRGHTPEQEARVRGLVGDVMSAVSPESLALHVERLSRYPGGLSKSRYVLRPECQAEARPYILETLASYLPGGAPVDTQRFGFTYYTCEQGTGGPMIHYPADNIVGTLPGSGRLGGCYIVCAHYDAIANRSFPGNYMWWCDHPAPGADDNATGVATVLEAARVLSGLTFPFDIRFILFSGEELGPVGSEVYADSVAAAGDTIYGVLNLDMVGHRARPSGPDTCHVVTNNGTRWFADFVVSTAETEYPDHFDGFDALVIADPLPYSDHASFWAQGYDAVVAIENAYAPGWTPHYHTIEDTLETVSIQKLAGVARLVAGSVARLADPDVSINLAVFEDGIRVTPADLDVGETAAVRVEVHVFGPEESVDMRLELWDGEPGAGDSLSSFSTERVMGGGETITHEFTWVLGPEDAGGHELTARVVADATQELSKSDNVAAIEVGVSGPDLRLMDVYTYPNPSSGPGDLAFRFELSSDAGGLTLQVFDLMGQELGFLSRSASPGAEEGTGTSAGWNTVPWGALDRAPGRLSSGVYVYRLSVFASGENTPSDEWVGKFAVLR